MALWRIRATVDDRPGYLSVLTASLALRSVNILAVQVHTTEAGAVDDFLVDAPDALTEADLTAAVVRGRGRDAFVARADAQGLADQPTRALAFAARLVGDPDGLGDALAVLLDTPDVSWRPVTTQPTPGLAPTRMCLADPAGGSYEINRAGPTFTPAEYARGQALVEVVTAVQRYHAEHVTLLLPDGTELLVRPAGPEDVAAAGRLLARCSPTTMRHHWLGASTAASPAALSRLLRPVGGLCLTAVRPRADGDEIIAVATLSTDGDLGELTVLVEDRWQRRGIATALLRRLLTFARHAGVVAVQAHARVDNVAIARTVRRIGATGEPERDGTVVTFTVPVQAAALTPGAPAGNH